MTDNTSWFAKPDEYMPSAQGRGPSERTWEDRFRGAVFGGAVGDALGAAVRYRTADEIQRWFGSHGVVDYLPVYGVRGAGTDLSQLSAFTLEALLRARAVNPDSGGRLSPEIVATSHLRWLYTQGVPWQYAMSTHLNTHPEPGSWLLERPELFSTRDPAGVALRGLGKLATTPPAAADEPPLGATSLAEPIVWAAPAMVWSGSEDVVFAAGAAIAGLLTRDANATGAAGLHCDVLGQLIRGAQLWDAVSASDTHRLGKAHRAASSPSDVRRAVHAAMFASHGARSPGPAELDTEFDTDGRPGELGIALASVACADSFAGAVRMAINQSADSCVTGALAGQLAGALHGPDAIPGHWLEELELGEVFGTLCDDAVEAFAPPPLPKWAQRYVTDTKRAFSGPLELPSSASTERDAAARESGSGPRSPKSIVDDEDRGRPHSVVAERVRPPAENFGETTVSETDPRSMTPDSSVRSAAAEPAVEVSPVEETMVLPMMGLKRSSGASRVPTQTQSAIEVSERADQTGLSRCDERGIERSPVESVDPVGLGSPGSRRSAPALGDSPEGESASVESTYAGSTYAGSSRSVSAYHGSGFPEAAFSDTTSSAAGLPAGATSAGEFSEMGSPESGPAESEFPETVVPQASEPDESPENLAAGSLAADPETSVVEDIEDPFAAGSGPTESDPEVASRAVAGGGHAKLEDADSPAPSLTERVLGCFLGGGIGNALAAGLEFASSQQISATFGPDGPDGLGEFDGVHGAITDVTQLSLFTAEGLIRASVGGRMVGGGDPLSEIHLAYQRWLHTQGVEWGAAAGAFRLEYPAPDGWLIEVPGLFAARSPGRTTVSALAGFGQGSPAGSLTESINDSKGRGAVVRAAPAALHSADPSEVFELAAAAAALTHGHPSGYLPAGALAVIVQQALLGRSLDDGVWLALQVLETWDEHEETTAMLKVAVELASHGVPTPQQVEQTLGDGWVGQQALAVAVCAALVGGHDVRLALRVAVHHSGDSAATAAVCGNIVGALLGVAELPVDWLADLELRDVVEQIALDCVAEFGVGEFLGDPSGVTPESAFGQPADEDWQERYPVRPVAAEADVDGELDQNREPPTQRLPSLPGSRELAESTALSGTAVPTGASASTASLPVPVSDDPVPGESVPIDAGADDLGAAGAGCGEAGAGQFPAQSPETRSAAGVDSVPGQGETGSAGASSSGQEPSDRDVAETVGQFPGTSGDSTGQTWPYEESVGAAADEGYRAEATSSEAESERRDADVRSPSAPGSDSVESGAELRAPKPAPRRINGVVADQRTE